jgi:aminopeptidase-like protein
MSYFEQTLDLSKIQNEMFDLMKELFPICRSITGNGVRQTLKILQNHIEIKINEVPTDTKVFDWTIPNEWNINDAYIINPNGEKIIDFKKNNLHVLNYSEPIKKKISLNELKSHIHTIPDQPDAIPYVKSYYKKNWGFCMQYNKFKDLIDGEYEICIDSSLKPGSLTYGEFYIKGEVEEEILISCYICHPSMCNDNLSGVVLCTYLAKYLKNSKNYFSYRILFIPETIGAITWLSLNEKNISKIKTGLLATCLGDPGIFTYKKSRNEDDEINKIVFYVLKNLNMNFNTLEFSPIGSDERQFCSLGINLSIGSLMRTPYTRFPEYHTSADNLEFVKKESLGESYKIHLDIINILEHNRTYLNLNPKCEPQLGKRGLYRNIIIRRLDGLIVDDDSKEGALLWILLYADGEHTLLDIAKKSNIDFNIIKEAAHSLYQKDLLKIIK